MLARLAVVLAAAGAIVFAGVRLDRDHACSDARARAFAIGLRKPVPGGAPRATRDLLDSCRGSSDLAAGAGSLQRSGHLLEAGRLASAATTREPDNAEGWIALALVLRRRGDEAAVRRVVARIHELNPRYVFPAA